LKQLLEEDEEKKVTTRLLLVDGFLGAGKTTLLLQAARLLTEKGHRVGLVTNDQADNLVDTAIVHAYDIPVMEIAGGCFCCRFPDLLAAIRTLRDTINPDIILGEPVGSCTDLIATIFRPLHTYYPSEFELAPLTVLLDPERKLESFPYEVGYIYSRQLAEANVIALSKSEMLAPDQLQERVQALQASYPKIQVVPLSAKTGAGLEQWLDICLQQSSSLDDVLDIDYETYAQGEAYLGWLNANITLQAQQTFYPVEWTNRFLSAIEHACVMHNAPIAHVKIFLTAPALACKISLTQIGGTPSWEPHPVNIRAGRAHCILNARVSIDPTTLKTIVTQALEQVTSPSGVQGTLTQLESFSPAAPEPTHRIA
jgi:G3E family GTPase